MSKWMHPIHSSCSHFSPGQNHSPKQFTAEGLSQSSWYFTLEPISHENLSPWETTRASGTNLWNSGSYAHLQVVSLPRLILALEATPSTSTNGQREGSSSNIRFFPLTIKPGAYGEEECLLSHSLQAGVSSVWSQEDLCNTLSYLAARGHPLPFYHSH